MNREDIIRMAREAGWPDSLVAPIIMAKLAEFAEIVRADEREACAALCERLWPGEDRSGHEWSDGFADGTCDCAAAIRARGETK